MGAIGTMIASIASLSFVKFSSHKRWLGILLAIVLIFGLFFRFVNLELKVYWVDETFTSLRISGYGMADVAKQAMKAEVMSVDELHRFQRINPDKTVFDTINALANEVPEHPPLYYVLVRSWVKWLGNSVAVTRCFSAVVSLLAFPAMYWLCWELFEAEKKCDRHILSNPIGWMETAILAVSPLHFLYAQEAREYSLWIVTILLAHAAFLRAVRQNRIRSWAIYTLILTAGLYTLPLTAFVACGHGIYLAVIERFRFTKIAIAYLLASFAAVLAFSPWLRVFLRNYNPATWQGENVSRFSLASGWIVNLSRVFIDVSANVENIWLGLPIAALVGYSAYCLYRGTPVRVWLFVGVAIGLIPLVLGLPDLLGGGVRSITFRYLIPSYLGVQLAVAYGLVMQMSRGNFRQQKLWQGVTSVVILGGIISGIISSQSQIWWNKDYYTSLYNVEAARIIESTPNPLVVSDNYTIIPLSYLLGDRDIKIQLMNRLPVNLKFNREFSSILLYGVSEELRSQFREKRYITNSILEPFLFQVKSIEDINESINHE